ncbi:hypothetical protein CsSME_00002507 [Camellia sinensis var. sinensis]|uniref:AP2-like ethylene-responsive transcription factor AIL6 n=1 Tax=Camellia sinensis TaxID=4442 RepID=UPI001035BD71|nr:AP2-like ethylene-responsive transcription factor AIL6 [Camellia sinensis]
MAPENSNWLSFSLSSVEMLNSSSSRSQMLQSTMNLLPFHGASPSTSTDDSHNYYFLDNLYANGWENTKPEGLAMAQSIGDSSIFTSFVDSQINQQPSPKLEDFLGGDSTLVRYSDSQTETQDSSLTHIYDQSGSALFADHPDFRTIDGGFQAFSTNSSSEIDDSASVPMTQLTSGDFSGQCPNSGLSLGGVVNTQRSEKALISVDSEETCKKMSDTFGQRTSIYRGVTRHRWTGRYEAHLWDNSCRREGQARKGRQVYLGGYDKEEKAARAYDLAALKYWGPTATTNFPVSNYTKELEEMKHVTKQEFIASLRRKSSGFSRGASIYRGVTRHHQQGRWQARIGRVAGNKDLYLGTFATQEEAAEAYDIAAIKFRGVNAVTNFEMNRYDVDTILKSALPIGGAAKRLKLSLEADQKPSLNNLDQQPQCSSNSSSSSIINFTNSSQPLEAIPCGVPFDSTARYHHDLFHLNSNSAVASDNPGSSSTMVTPMTFLPSAPEFFIWPHQSY